MRETFESRREVGARETLAILLRAARYVAPFKGRFALKGVLTLASLFPPLLLPWPIKLQIDSYLGDRPVVASEYPWFVRPLVEPLEGASPGEVLFATLAFQLFLVVTIGAWGSLSSERDQADAHISSGRDTATTTENDANYGHSRASGLLGLLEFHLTLRLTQALNHHYRSRLFERIHALPITAFDDERIGDAIYRVMYDTPAITQVVYRLLLIPLYAPLGILLVAATVNAAYGQTRLGWAALSLLPLLFVATFPFSAWIRRRGEESRMAGATTASTIEEGLANVVAVQSLGAEARERERFGRHSWDSFRRYRAYVVAWIGAVVGAVVIALPLVWWLVRYGTDLVIEGTLTTGDFALLLTYFAQLATYSIIFGTLWVRLQGNAAGLHRVFLLMDLPGEQDRPGAAPLAPLEREVRLEGVGFRYEDGTRALEDVDLRCRVGEMTALVGAAGAGKTTLAYLVARFVEPSEGSVRFDGHDIAGATLASVRSQVAFVFQEQQLFDATVAENIRVGKPAASETEVRRAAKLAGADGFVRALPQGYATRLGRGGGKLSVGQKQRLSIARALVRDAPILILDEPSSALDPETEAELLASLRGAARDRVLIVIAHRLSTVRRADQILFLAGGRVAERGTHDELMTRSDGQYRRFVELQTRRAAVGAGMPLS